MPCGDSDPAQAYDQRADVVANPFPCIGSLEVGQREDNGQCDEDNPVQDAQRTGLKAQGALQVQVTKSEGGQADDEAKEMEVSDPAHWPYIVVSL